ncbi:hypothetical protein APHHGE2_0342 [Anaplasma phagocytophilum str. HGE2]|nr:hypothetical protein APHHGE2_0342 [Anaplasma phagocytophilum str. HGE2]
MYMVGSWSFESQGCWRTLLAACRQDQESNSILGGIGI